MEVLEPRVRVGVVVSRNATSDGLATPHYYVDRRSNAKKARRVQKGELNLSGLIGVAGQQDSHGFCGIPWERVRDPTDRSVVRRRSPAQAGGVAVEGLERRLHLRL